MSSKKRLLTVSFICCLSARVVVAQPSIADVVPRGLMPGKTTEVELLGDKLTAALSLWISSGSKVENIKPAKDGKSLTCNITVGAQAETSIIGLVAADAAGITDPFMMMIDTLDSVKDVDSNHEIKSAQLITTPVAIDGRSDGAELDYYRFPVNKGKRVSIEVIAQRMASAMDPVIRLLDEHGRQIDSADDDLGIGADCRLQFVSIKDGHYVLEVSDNRFQSGGAYRLRIGDFPIITVPFPLGGRIGATSQFRFIGPSPDMLPVIKRISHHQPFGQIAINTTFAGGKTSGMAQIAVGPDPEFAEGHASGDRSAATPLTIPCAISGVLQKPKEQDSFDIAVAKGQRVDCTGLSRRFGSPALVHLRLLNVEGKSVAETPVNDNEEPSFSYTAPSDGIYRLVVRDVLHRGGLSYAYRIAIGTGPDFSLLLKHDAATQIKFKSPHENGAIALTVQVQRRGFDGPIQLALEDDEPRFKLYNHVIPAKQNEVRMFVVPSSDVKPGEFRQLRVIGVGAPENGAGPKIRRIVGTEPTLRAKIPQLLYPHAWQNGLLTMTTSAPGKPFFAIKAEQASLEIAPGGHVDFSFVLERKDEKFKSNISVFSEDLPDDCLATVKTEKDQYTVQIKAEKNTPVGEFKLRLVTIGEHNGIGQNLVHELPVRIKSENAVAKTATDQQTVQGK